MSGPPLTCAEALELLHDEADGRLPASREAELRAHVAACAECAKASRQMAALRALFRAAPPVPAPAGFTEGVMDRLPRGRLLAFPRVLFPVAAAAALLVGAVVIANFGPRGERETALAPQEKHNGFVAEAPPPASGLAAEDAVEAARRESRSAPGGRAAPAAAGAPADVADHSAAKAPAAPALPGASGVTGSGASRPPAGAPATPPVADKSKLGKDRAARGEPQREASEFERAAEDADTCVVVFRTEAAAQAFLRSLGAAADPSADDRAKKSDVAAADGDGKSAPAGGKRAGTLRDAPTSGGGGGDGGGGGAGGGTGGGATGAGASAGGGAAGGGGAGPAGGAGGVAKDAGTARQPGGAAAAPEESAGAQSTGLAAPARRLLGRALVEDATWAARAAELGGRVVLLSEADAARTANESADRAPLFDDAFDDALRADARRLRDEETKRASAPATDPEREKSVADGEPAPQRPAKSEEPASKPGGPATPEPAAPAAERGPTGPAPPSVPTPVPTPAPPLDPAPAPSPAPTAAPAARRQVAAGTAAPRPSPAPPRIVLVVVDPSSPSAR